MSTEAAARAELDRAALKMIAAKQTNSATNGYNSYKPYYDAAVNDFRAKGYKYEVPQELQPIDPNARFDNPSSDIAKLRKRAQKVGAVVAPGNGSITVAPWAYDGQPNHLDNGTLVNMKIGGVYISTPKQEFSFQGSIPFAKANQSDKAMPLRMARSEKKDGPNQLSDVRIAIDMQRADIRAHDPGIIGTYGHLFFTNFGSTGYTWLCGDWDFIMDHSPDASGMKAATSWHIIRWGDRQGVETPLPYEQYILWNNKWQKYLKRLDDGQLALEDQPDARSIVTFEILVDQQADRYNGAVATDRLEDFRRAEIDILQRYDAGQVSGIDALRELRNQLLGLLGHYLSYIFEWLGEVLAMLWEVLKALLGKLIGDNLPIILLAAGAALFVFAKIKSN
jgi:hypothetical protein